MDETAIKFYVQHRGLIVKRARHVFRPKPTQQVSRAQQRTCISHVAFVCSVGAVQPYLPQFFISSEHALRVAEVQTLQHTCLPNMCVLRRKSAWVDTAFMTDVMRSLGRALLPWAAEFQPVLLMDCHLTHLAAPVLRAAGAAGIWVLPLPAKMTWLMQPLDTHVFAAYKAAIRRRYVTHLAADEAGRVANAKMVEIALNAASEVLHGRPHDRAFQQNGFGSQQGMLRRSLLLHLGTEERAPAPRGLPTLPELHAYLGVRTAVDLGALFSGICRRPGRPPVIDLTQDADPPANAEEEDSQAWSERLRPRRSTSRLALSQPSPAPPESGAGPSAEPPLPPPPAWPPMESPPPPGPGPVLRRRLTRRLKKQAAEMRATKAKVIKELKNAQKRKRRLQTKVRALSDQDLLAVLLMRKDAGGASSGSAAAPQAGAAEPAAEAAAGAPA